MTLKKVQVADPRPTAYYPDGVTPLAGGKIFTYVAGTTTKTPTWTDATGLTPNTNPVICDANGKYSIWIAPLVPSPENPLPPGPPGPPGPAGSPGTAGTNGRDGLDGQLLVSVADFTAQDLQNLVTLPGVLVPAPLATQAIIPIQTVFSSKINLVEFDSGAWNAQWESGISIYKTVPDIAIMTGANQSDMGVLNAFSRGFWSSSHNYIDNEDIAGQGLFLISPTPFVSPNGILTISASGGTGYVVGDTGFITATLANPTTLTSPADGLAMYEVTSIGVSGAITGARVIAQGVGYAEYWTFNLVTGGTRPGVGTGGTATLTIPNPTGPITASVCLDAGTGYAVGDTGHVQGGGANATYVIDTVSGGAILTYHLVNHGTGYSSVSDAGFINGGAQPGAGAGGEFDLYVTGGASQADSSLRVTTWYTLLNFAELIGAITASTLNAGGTGYAVGDTGTVVGGNSGANYIITSVSGGVVTGYTITSAGLGYAVSTGVSTFQFGAQPGAGSGFKINITTIV